MGNGKILLGSLESFCGGKDLGFSLPFIFRKMDFFYGFICLGGSWFVPFFEVERLHFDFGGCYFSYCIILVLYKSVFYYFYQQGFGFLPCCLKLGFALSRHDFSRWVWAGNLESLFGVVF